VHCASIKSEGGPSALLYYRSSISPWRHLNTGLLLQTEDVSKLPACRADGSVVMNSSASEPNQIRVVVLVDEFGLDTCVVNEVCQLLEDMPPPWSAYRAFEAAMARFPNIDRGALRLTVLAVLTGQRHCANRMTTAGLNSG